MSGANTEFVSDFWAREEEGKDLACLPNVEPVILEAPRILINNGNNHAHKMF